MDTGCCRRRPHRKRWRCWSGHPDVELIFSDVQMPRCDGLSMVRQLRRRGIVIPALLTSGMHAPEPWMLPARTGFLPKPYRRTDLLAALDRLQTGS